MKKLFSTLLVLAVIASVSVACKKGEEQKTEGHSSAVQTPVQNVVAQEQTAPVSDTVTAPVSDTITTPSETQTQPDAVSTTQPDQKNP